VFPLYPQYAAATTATVNDVVFQDDSGHALAAGHSAPCRPIMTIRCMSTAHGEVRSRRHVEGLDLGRPDVVLTSYPRHSAVIFPQRGDPYHCHCMKTARLMRERARLAHDDKLIASTFQSRFGPEEWLQPYTDKTVENSSQRTV
jgi:ferrochelatase